MILLSNPLQQMIIIILIFLVNNILVHSLYSRLSSILINLIKSRQQPLWIFYYFFWLFFILFDSFRYILIHLCLCTVFWFRTRLERIHAQYFIYLVINSFIRILWYLTLSKARFMIHCFVSILASYRFCFSLGCWWTFRRFVTK